MGHTEGYCGSPGEHLSHPRGALLVVLTWKAQLTWLTTLSLLISQEHQGVRLFMGKLPIFQSL